MALAPRLIEEVFPKVKFAFFGNYVNRYRRKLLRKVRSNLIFRLIEVFYSQELPSIDLILAVENTKDFHT